MFIAFGLMADNWFIMLLGVLAFIIMAITDPKLVPYGAMTATFYTGVGCLLAPSVLYLGVRVVL
jgi:hypothetical protein